MKVPTEIGFCWANCTSAIINVHRLGAVAVHVHAAPPADHLDYFDVLACGGETIRSWP